MNLCVLLAFGLTAQAAADPAPIHHALLIGLSDYSKAGKNADGKPFWDDLTGPTDVESLKKVILETGVFKQDDILPLTGKVTREQMVKAFRSWILNPGGRPARKGDVLYVHFSGHGYRFPARKGSPAFKIGYESGLVFSDSKGDDPDTFLTNTDLAKLITGVSTDASFTITVDACNSGDVTRSRGIFKSRGRSAPGLAMRSRGGDSNPDDKGPFFTELTGPYEAISACKSDQVAHDSDGGLFSTCLAKALHEVAVISKRDHRAVTYRELYERICDHILQLDNTEGEQTPVPLGDKNRVVFGAELLDVPPYFATSFSGDSLRLEAGSIFGIRKRQAFELYRPGGSPTNGAKPVAVGIVADTIDGLSYNRAYLEFPKGVSAASLQGCWAYPKSDGVDPGMMPVCFQGLPPVEKVSLLDQIRRQSAAIVETNIAHAEVIIEPAATIPSDVEVMTSGGKVLGTFSEDAAGRAQLAERVRELQSWRALMALPAPDQSTCPEVSVQIVPVKTVEQGNRQVFDSVCPDRRTFRAGDRFAVKVMAKPSETQIDPSVTILELTPDHRVLQFWPSPKASESGHQLPADGKWYWLERDQGFVPVDSPDKSRIAVPYFAPTRQDLKPGAHGVPDGVGGVVFKAFVTQDSVDFTPVLSKLEPKGAMSPLAGLINDFCKGRRGPPAILDQYRIVTRPVETIGGR